MPSIHIPEDVWAELLMQNDGDRAKAREDVKTAAREKANE